MTLLKIWLAVGALGITLLNIFILYFNYKELHMKITRDDALEMFVTTLVFTILGFVGFIATFGIFVFGSFVLWKKSQMNEKEES